MGTWSQPLCLSLTLELETPDLWEYHKEGGG